MADEQQPQGTPPQDGTPPANPINPPAPAANPTEDRIKDLSGKVKKTAEERDAEALLRQQAEKTAAFAEGFIDVVVANPAAKDHKDQIKEKVLAGYSLQDATYAVLGPIGKLGQSVAPIVPTGGSAPNIIVNPAAKPIDQMSREDMRSALLEAQRKGDLGLS